jgi:acyl-CoA thioesterase
LRNDVPTRWSHAASKALGIAIEIPQAGSAVAQMTVRDDMVNGFDVCHGGLLFTLADTAFAFACNAYDNVTFAASANIEFIRPARLGDELRARAREDAASANIEFIRPARLGDELRALAREDYRGRKRGFYTVEVRNQRDEVIAMFRGRSASRGEPKLC